MSECDVAGVNTGLKFADVIDDKGAFQCTDLTEAADHLAAIKLKLSLPAEVLDAFVCGGDTGPVEFSVRHQIEIRTDHPGAL
ncbi:hypothetical protein D9M68_928570 [compost metagenome]